MVIPVFLGTYGVIPRGSFILALGLSWQGMQSEPFKTHQGRVCGDLEVAACRKALRKTMFTSVYIYSICLFGDRGWEISF